MCILCIRCLFSLFIHLHVFPSNSLPFFCSVPHHRSVALAGQTPTPPHLLPSSVSASKSKVLWVWAWRERAARSPRERLKPREGQTSTVTGSRAPVSPRRTCPPPRRLTRQNRASPGSTWPPSSRPPSPATPMKWGWQQQQGRRVAIWWWWPPLQPVGAVQPCRTALSPPPPPSFSPSTQYCSPRGGSQISPTPLQAEMTHLCRGGSRPQLHQSQRGLWAGRSQWHGPALCRVKADSHFCVESTPLVRHSLMFYAVAYTVAWRPITPLWIADHCLTRNVLKMLRLLSPLFQTTLLTTLWKVGLLL